MGNHFSNIKPLSGLYKEWFLDYASYVILERAIPNILDGLKPVQRRILHSLKELHDGRYHKVANVIGNTMNSPSWRCFHWRVNYSNWTKGFIIG